MKRESPIESRFKREELKSVDEIIIKECNYVDNPLKYCEVFKFFDCNNSSLTRYQIPSFCGNCPYIYKLDMTRPGAFGCCVKDYIENVKRQFRPSQKP